MTVRIRAEALRTIQSHASLAFPEECCGALLGHGVQGCDSTVLLVVPLTNGSPETRDRRFLIPPDAVRRVERSAAERAMDLLGFYHSHPNAPAIPSTHDRECAWPAYTYLIVPVQRDRAGTPRAWVLAEDRTGFAEREIHTDLSPR
jgi:proteasome lid subunit RPN8/RPN11